jgi:hypothetical protein
LLLLLHQAALEHQLSQYRDVLRQVAAVAGMSLSSSCRIAEMVPVVAALRDVKEAHDTQQVKRVEGAGREVGELRCV